MGSSGDESIDWIREFKAPDQSFALSSDSSPESTPKLLHGNSEVERPIKKEAVITVDSGEDTPVSKPKLKAPKKKGHILNEDGQVDTKVKTAGSSVSSRLPLVFPDKVQRSKALIECDGDSIDLSGDIGAVGRVIISNGSSGKHELRLDLKGTVYKATIIPSRTFCVVSVGQSEAKIEAIMNDFIRLEPQSNMFEDETMIEGTLNGFSFDSDEEGEKNSKVLTQHGDPNNETEGQTNKKVKGKRDKSVGTPNKRSKASGRTPKKAARKSQVAKRIKKSKK